MRFFKKKYFLFYCGIIHLSLVSVAQTNNITSNSQAGTIAADAIKMEVDEMSRYFGKFAVVKKAQSEALINDKGEIVVPFNTYKFGEELGRVDNYGTGKIGCIFFNDNYHGALAEFQKSIDYLKLIPFVEIKTDKEGYITTSGGTVFRKKHISEDGNYSNPFWLGLFDDHGFRNIFSYPGLFTEDGLLLSEKYDGTFITGKGNYKKINNQGAHLYINFALVGYSTADNNNHTYANQSKSIWTNGLTPARYLTNGENGNYYTQTKDPVKIREAKNIAIGFINKKGEFQIKPNYYSVSQFSEGLSFVSKINEFDELSWGAIDTTGKLIIPYKFKLHPGRFSHGLSIIKAKDMDNINYGFINKKGEIVFTIPKKNGDTLSIELGLKNEFHDQDYPLFYGYDGFYFMEGYQYVRLTLKDPSTHGGSRTEVVLIDTLGHFIPIEKIIKEKLPPDGRVEIVSNIKSGQFLYRYTRSLYINGSADENGEYNALGIADINGNIILPPKFQQLSLFEKESNLQFAQQGKVNKYSAIGVEGYIDRSGVFRIIKVNPKGGF